MNYTNLHIVFPYLITVSGYAVGIYFFIRPLKVNDQILKVNLIVYALLDIYVAIVYTMILLGPVTPPPDAAGIQASMLMRPANLLMVLLPYWIARRMRTWMT